RTLYADVADVVARDTHDVVLAAAGIHVERGALQRLRELVPGDGSVALVSDSNVAGIHGMDAQLALGARLTETHELPPGAEVKTGLLAGEPFWELPEVELVRRCAAFKAAICLRDPHEQGERAVLNLGHTFAHALEAAAGYEGLTHGRAVALGLLAALHLSGRDTRVVEEVLRPQPARVDRERAWAAMHRDKKARAGEIRLVL